MTPLGPTHHRTTFHKMQKRRTMDPGDDAYVTIDNAYVTIVVLKDGIP